MTEVLRLYREGPAARSFSFVLQLGHYGYVWCSPTYVGFVRYHKRGGPAFTRVDYPSTGETRDLALGCYADEFIDPLIDFLVELHPPWAEILHEYATTAERVVGER